MTSDEWQRATQSVQECAMSNLGLLQSPALVPGPFVVGTLLRGRARRSTQSVEAVIPFKVKYQDDACIQA